MNKKLKLIAIGLLSTAALASCATVSNIGTDNWRDYFKPGRSKDEIARDFNLYRGKWWNYYVRGRWYADGGHLDESIRDFQKAIALRGKDSRSARSYGLHFWEYFAHRELGIVYYEQKNYDEARKELEASLSTADSARAKFYLNKCNEAILKTTKGDLEPPQIKVASHTDGQIVNTPVARLKGAALDDGFVNSISVQGKKLFIELAEKRLNFSEDVSLRMGENMVSLEASDLLGKSTRQDMKLILDMRPPIMYLDDVQTRQKDGKRTATIKGTAVDDYGIKSLYIENVEIPIPPGKEVDFQQDVAVASGSRISFRVIDSAGNETKGDIPLDTKATLWPMDLPGGIKYAYQTNTQPLLLAANKMDGPTVQDLLIAQNAGTAQPAASSGADAAPPVIKADLKSATVYDTNMFISGSARDDGGVAKLSINNSPLDIRPGKNVFFNYLLTLNEGENPITIKAVDTHGNEAMFPPVKITKKTFELLETDARYTVALLPLRTFTEQGLPSETIYSQLLKAFDEEPKRFNFVERDRAKLEEILHEQKITNTELTSPDTAIRIGKIRAAEGMLFGAVEEDAKGVNISLRLVDTETTQVLANTDVYDEDKSAKNLEWLMHGLSLKMKQQFPMVQGNVVLVSGSGFHVNVGASSGIGVGMKLLLFREIQEEGLALKEPLEIVARVSQVQKDSAFAKIIAAKGDGKIEKKDLVITK